MSSPVWTAAIAAFALVGLAAPTSAQVRLSELLADPSGSDDHEEFVELQNCSEVEPVDLSGWAIDAGEDIDAIVDAGWGLVLAPGQRAVVVDASYPGNSAVYDSVQEWAVIVTIEDRSFGRSGLSNSKPQRVALRRPGGDLADECTYDPGLGRPGHSWERADDPVDAWRVSLLPGGTPGRPNSVNQEPAPAGRVTIEASPDPFRDTVEFLCRVHEAPTLLAVSVFDAEGTRIARIRDWEPAALETRVVWDGVDGRGRPVAPGTYIVLVESSAAGRVTSGRRLIVKRD